ncbi:exosome complex protein Rrp42 [Candidatus Woesearchaeota archaeon]|nr:exosome complex protein Rrp42 [Candidatus Woesearchaeota archaeon]
MREIAKIIKNNLRIDGRKLLEYRNIEYKQGVIETAEGSAWVRAGNMEVLAGVKISIMEPYPDTPDEGALMVDTQLLPLSNPHFTGGPPDNATIEVARVIDRGLREGEAVDRKKLVIKEGEKVWAVSIDVIPLNYDGNLIDIGGIAAMLALMNTRLPELIDGKINYKKLTDKRLPIKHIPIPITVYKINGNYFVDPTDEEERVAEVRLTVTVLENGKICALQKGGYGTLTMKDIEEITAIAIEKSKELREKIFKSIGGE